MFFPTGASVNDLTNLARSPANSMFLAYFTALEAASLAFTPIKSVARAQAEMIGFMSRRTRACFEAPAQLISCRNPQDVLHEQMRFWDLAAEQYNETSKRILEAWTPVVAAAAVDEAEKPAVPVTRTHDYIEFPVAKRSRRPVDYSETRAMEFA